MTRTRVLATIMGFLSLLALSFAGAPASAAPAGTGLDAAARQSAEVGGELVSTARYHRRYYGRRVYYRRPVYVRRVYGRRYYRRY